MGLLRIPVRLIGRASRRIALRSRWLAERFWLVAAAEVAFISRRHWRRLDPDERRHLLDLLWKAKGRPSKLTESEKREASLLLQKLDYAELGGNVAGIVLPFGPLARLVRFGLGRTGRSGRAEATEA
jgi:hypothetical protein